ncbi:hypothetical protein EV426DRAFT_609172 [Tirmania nivea]|nr:hypothetical protein EV426DRAFT_609172 [Tirmania nivea]
MYSFPPTLTLLSSQNHSWISSAQVASKIILLARTTPLSLFFIDFDQSQPTLKVHSIKKMGGRAIDANEVFFDWYKIPEIR